jgi:hypothetical protein
MPRIATCCRHGIRGYDDNSRDKRVRGNIARRLDAGDAHSDRRDDYNRHLRGLW